MPGGNGGGGEGRGGGGLWLKVQPERGPQSAQSVQGVQMPYSAPLPPSSQSPSEAKLQVLTHVPEPGGPGGGLGLGGGRGLRGTGERRGGLGGGRVQKLGRRGPQSAQSEQGAQNAYSLPMPPSSQSPSPDQMQSSRHVS